MDAMAKRRQAIAVVCIALIVVAGILPLGGLSLDWLITTPAFVLLAAPATTARLPQISVADEQPLELLAPLDSRGPPLLLSPA